jgi:hypothetical protein
MNYCTYSAGCDLAIRVRFPKMFCVRLIRVSKTDLMTQKSSAPFSDLNCPDIFCLTFIFLMALSDALLSGGTLWRYKKIRIDCLYLNSLFCTDTDSLWLWSRDISSILSGFCSKTDIALSCSRVRSLSNVFFNVIALSRSDLIWFYFTCSPRRNRYEGVNRV